MEIKKNKKKKQNKSGHFSGEMRMTLNIGLYGSRRVIVLPLLAKF